MNTWPQYTASDAIHIQWTDATPQQLADAGCHPIVTAGSTEILWKK